MKAFGTLKSAEREVKRLLESESLAYEVNACGATLYPHRRGDQYIIFVSVPTTTHLARALELDHRVQRMIAERSRF